MITIKLTKKHLDLCEKFASEIDTSHYSFRSQNDPEKRKFDQKIGKLGELAVYEYLKDKLDDLTKPDFKIYKPKEKSWAFDMTAKDINLHVKSQASIQAKKYGESWIFQASMTDKRRGYDKEIFDRTSPNQYVAFVVVDIDGKVANIMSIVALDFLHDKKLFKLPIVPRLQIANKLAVYNADLTKFADEELWQL